MAYVYWWIVFGPEVYPRRQPNWTAGKGTCTQLRQWFRHKAENFGKFSNLYRAELDTSPQAYATTRQVIHQSKKGMLTLLSKAKDPETNHAIVLKRYLYKMQLTVD